MYYSIISGSEIINQIELMYRHIPNHHIVLKYYNEVNRIEQEIYDLTLTENLNWSRIVKSRAIQWIIVNHLDQILEKYKAQLTNNTIHGKENREHNLIQLKIKGNAIRDSIHHLNSTIQELYLLNINNRTNITIRNLRKIQFRTLLKYDRIRYHINRLETLLRPTREEVYLQSLL